MGFFGKLKTTSLITAAKSTTKISIRNTAATTVEVQSPRVVESATEETAKNRQTALERVRFIEFVRQIKYNLRLSDQLAVTETAIRHANRFPILLTAGKKGASALNYANYRVWAKRYDGATKGREVEALCDQNPIGLRSRYGDARFWEYAMAIYLNQNRLPATQAYKIAVLKMRDVDRNALLPSYSQFYFRINQLPGQMVALAREGEEAYNAKYAPYIDRDWSSVAAGECVVCDSRTFDTRVRKWDEAAGKWRAARPTVAMMIDAKSWYAVSYWITTDNVNSSVLIDTLALFLFNNNNVPPAVAYCDNGADYCKSGFSTPLEGACIFDELGIKLINSLAYNARAKTVERFFKDMMQQFDKNFADYLGSRPGERSQAADWFERHPEELPSEEQFGTMFAQWINSTHNTARNGKIHQGKSPAEIWNAREVKPPYPAERLPFAFLLPIGLRTVRRGPAVEVDKIAFFSDSLENYITKKVLVKIDRLNDNHVFCFDSNGRMIGEAKTKQSINALGLNDPGCRNRISAEMARKRRALRNTYLMIKKETGGYDRVSPLEIFAASPDSKIISGGSICSIKGRAHRYTHHTISESENITPQKETPIPTAAIPQKENEYSDLSDFHNFMLKNNIKNQEDYDDNEL